MNVVLASYTRNAEELCALAASTCYSAEGPSKKEFSVQESVKLLDKVIKSGHLSVIEHACYTFFIEDVSRSLTHQLVRHRIASFSQQSQRYVKMDGGFGCIIPVSINEAGLSDEFKELMDDISRFYDKAIVAGVPPEDARFVLPNACATNITVTMNARELFHFFSLRCCNKAQWEIRDMAWQMYDLCMDASPHIFKYAGPKCWHEKCIEAKPCGNPPKKMRT